MPVKRLGLSVILLLAACTPAPDLTPSAASPTMAPETAPVIATAGPEPTGIESQPKETAGASATRAAKATETPALHASPAASETPVPKATLPASDTPVPADTPVPVETPVPPTVQASPTSGPGLIAPYPGAPLCEDSGSAHYNSVFHTLWESGRGCHYDHEHGQFPFSPEVAASFPGMDLGALIGGVGVGHTNPSGPMENTHKHGGFKWDVTLTHSVGCFGGEGYPTGVDAMVIQYHAFGDYAIELESRVHSAVGVLRQCQLGNPTDFGYVFVNQLQDYGQRVAPYQGSVLPYPDTPNPAYNANLAPYFTVSCFGTTVVCAKFPTRDDVIRRNNNASSTWVSAPSNIDGSGSSLFAILFRVRDNYQMLDDSDLTYPFSFAWLCSADGGQTYSPVPNCRYNNTTTRVHEVIGDIPVEWDNLAAFDTDPRPGRITALGYVTRFGDLNMACVAPGSDCHPIKLIQAFTGRYLSQFSLVAGEKASFSAANLPERDLYFCNGVLCAEGDPGAVPSGWLGQNN